MVSKMISVILVAALLHGSIAAQDQPQSPPQTVARMQQFLHKAQEKDKAVKVILNKKIDKQKKFSGKVSDISDTGFVVTDQKTGKPMADVREVHQRSSKKEVTIVIVVGAGVVLLVLLFIGSKVHD